MRRRRSVLFAVLLIVTVALGAGAIYVGIQLQEQPDLSPEETAAASQQVWDAEIPRNQTERLQFASRWEPIKVKSFEEQKAFLDGEGARFRSEAPILNVGNETLYGRDLNYYMFLLQFETYVSSEALTDADVDQGLNVLINHSLILQKAEELGLTTLSNNVYNDPKKNFTDRNRLVTKMLPKVEPYVIETIEAEVISIWFRNNIVPVSVEEGKKIAKAKIDDLWERIDSEKITMKEAGDIIIADNEIETKVDPAADGNAYASFTAQRDGFPAFNSDELNRQLWSLGEGQMTNVITVTNAIADPEFEGEEIFFAIIKVNKRTLGEGFGSTDDYFEKAADEAVKEGEASINIHKGGTTQ